MRRIFYNLTTTWLSVVVAQFIGTVELAQVLIGELDLYGRVADAVANLSFDQLGYVLVVLFMRAWGISYLTWKFGDFEAEGAGTTSS